MSPSSLTGLHEGQRCQISPESVERLWDAVGGREKVAEAKVKALESHAIHLSKIGRPNLRLEKWIKEVSD
jgi:hypothetical protein